MKRSSNKSHCPINFFLETFGDSWSLLIIRDIAFFGKKTFKEFLNSDEKIASNILASRLEQLEKNGIIHKKKDSADKRRAVYGLTEKGIEILPVLLEMGGWSSHHDPQTTAPKQFVAAAYADRYGVFKLVADTVRRGGSIFAGEDSVISQMMQQQKENDHDD